MEKHILKFKEFLSEEKGEWFFIKNRQGDWEKEGPYKNPTAAYKANLVNGTMKKVSDGWYEINKRGMEGDIQKHAIVRSDKLSKGGWE